MEVKKEIIRSLAEQYNNEEYFRGDPIIFPKHFARIMLGESGIEGLGGKGELSGIKYTLQDVEIAAVIAAHLAWGRRDMIVRDCKRAFDEMNWQPYKYIMSGSYRNEDASLHRTIKWSEFAAICTRLKEFYTKAPSLEILTPDEIRVRIYGQKSDPKAANKKIHMMRRWMVRNDGIVDLGLWKSTSPASLVIPLDVHVHRSSRNLGITSRNSADITTAMEITRFLSRVFPGDPCKGDFALFAYAASIK
ncbi:MAG: DUF2400 domain-containing protein [Bacteroidales bacterium]|nr:DUF2400 domain-containing protein [Bacteroidales bacterium]